MGIPQENQVEVTRRRNQRYPFMRTADWDFFTAATGAKSGFIENVSQGGCLLRTGEPIEHRRWIRLVVREPERNLWFTAVGRIIRREDRMEPWDDRNVTLHRYGVEFIHPLNPLVLGKISQSATPCVSCGMPTASIPDLARSGAMFCVLCHLRKACHNLLVQDGLEGA